jgi:hypothetical protein
MKIFSIKVITGGFLRLQITDYLCLLLSASFYAFLHLSLFSLHTNFTPLPTENSLI